MTPVLTKAAQDQRIAHAALAGRVAAAEEFAHSDPSRTVEILRGVRAELLGRKPRKPQG